MDRSELLVLLRSVEAMGMHEHRRTGLIPRTPGLKPDEALERVDQYAREFAICELEKVKFVNTEIRDAKAQGDYESGFDYGIDLMIQSINQAIKRLKGTEDTTNKDV